VFIGEGNRGSNKKTRDKKRARIETALRDFDCGKCYDGGGEEIHLTSDAHRGRENDLTGRRYGTEIFNDDQLRGIQQGVERVLPNEEEAEKRDAMEGEKKLRSSPDCTGGSRDSQTSSGDCRIFGNRKELVRRLDQPLKEKKKTNRMRKR